MVRTHIDAIEHAAIFRQQRFEPAENMVEVLERNVAARDLRAVGDRDGEQAGLPRRRYGVAGVRNRHDVVGLEHALQAGLQVEHAVDVEKDRRALVAQVLCLDEPAREIALGGGVAGGGADVAHVFRRVVGGDARARRDELWQHVRGQVEPLFRRDVREKIRRGEIDAGRHEIALIVGAGKFARQHGRDQAFALMDEIGGAGMIVGMRDDRDQRALRAMERGEGAKRDIEQHVAVDEERVAVRRRKRREAASGAERRVLDKNVEAQAERARLLAERRDQRGAEMAGEHRQGGDALAPQHAHLAKDDRHASDRQQRLRHVIAGERTGAGA